MSNAAAPRKTTVVTVKSDAEMLAEILPDLEAAFRRGETLATAADLVHMARTFGAKPTDIAAAHRRARAAR